jgi:hypothetical protein
MLPALKLHTAPLEAGEVALPWLLAGVQALAAGETSFQLEAACGTLLQVAASSNSSCNYAA